MSFIPGSIAGDIILGIDGFTQPLLQAEHLAEVFPGLMEQSLAQPLRELGEVASQIGGSLIEPFKQIDASASDSAAAVEDAGAKMEDGMKRGSEGMRDAGHSSEEMGHSILRSMIEAHALMELFPDWVATLWANPLLGIVDLARETGDALVEVFNHVADDALDMELAAEKLGVSVEFFSQWAGVAKTVKVDAEQLSNGMYMLNRIVGEELTNPTKQLTTAFNYLGISQQWLNDNAGNSEAIFLRVRDAMGQLTDAQHRSYVVQELLSRGARDLIPLFLMQTREINGLMEAQKQFGDVTDEKEAQAGKAFKKLKVEFDEMVDGLEKKASVYILDFIMEHGPEIEKELHKISDEGQKELTKLANWAGTIKWGDDFKLALDDLDKVLAAIPGIASEIKSVVSDVAPEIKQLLSWLGDIFVGINNILGIVHPEVANEVDKAGNLKHGTGSGTKGTDAIDAGLDVLFDGPNPYKNSTAHLDPGARQRLEQYITKELHIHVTPGTTDQELGNFVNKAIAKAKADAKAAATAAATGGVH